MSRVARIVVPGFPHLVTHRGNRPAGLAGRAEAYPWSSAAAHCGLRADPVLSTAFPPAEVIDDWATWLREGLLAEEAAWKAIRQHTHTGRPCGSSTFLQQLETKFGRPLRPQRRGPKPGAKYGKRKKIK